MSSSYSSSYDSSSSSSSSKRTRASRRISAAKPPPPPKPQKDSDSELSNLSDVSDSSSGKPASRRQQSSSIDKNTAGAGGYFDNNQDMMDDVQEGANWWQATNSLMSRVNQRDTKPVKVSSFQAPAYDDQKSSSGSSDSSDSGSKKRSKDKGKDKKKRKENNKANDNANAANNEPLQLNQESDQKNQNDAVIDFDPTNVFNGKTYKDTEQDFLLMDVRSPLIWTIGFLVLALVHIVLTLVVAKFKFKTGQQNPYVGVTLPFLLKGGAAYSQWIKSGDWWRLFTSISLQPGIVHYAVMIICMGLLYEVERFNGFWVAMLLFLLSGLYGNVFSLLMVPDTIICGASGCVSGWLGFSLVRLCAKFSQKRRICYLITEILMLVVLVFEGLLPFINNFQNVAGLILGILISFSLLPNNSRTKCRTIARGIIAFLSFPIMIIIFSVVVVFYIKDSNISTKCKICSQIDCQNFAKIQWCPTNQDTLSAVAAFTA